MSNLFDLGGLTVFITGASSGIGRAIAIEVASAGASIVLSGRDPERLRETQDMLQGTGHMSVTADLSDISQLKELTGKIPAIDGFVNSAGYGLLRPLKYIDESFLEKMHAVNYKAPVLLTNELAKHKKLRSGASVVYITSIAGLIGSAGNAAYGGAKAALVGSSKTFAIELAKQKIRVNCVSPGMVRTPLTDETLKTLSPELLARDEALYPLGYGEVNDVAAAVVYLLSPGARWVTGTNLVLDGGFTAR
jgi:NAD(P)-dependent dehydrogenase (short-subunit alcohol dehydrogenase family)